MKVGIQNDLFSDIFMFAGRKGMFAGRKTPRLKHAWSRGNPKIAIINISFSKDNISIMLNSLIEIFKKKKGVYLFEARRTFQSPWHTQIFHLKNYRLWRLHTKAIWISFFFHHQTCKLGSSNSSRRSHNFLSTSFEYGNN